MIKFKQKIFWGTALTVGSTIGATVLGGKMADNTQKKATIAQQEMQEQTNKQMANQTKALNNLAKAASKNPQSGPMLAQAGLSGQRSYSILGNGILNF